METSGKPCREKADAHLLFEIRIETSPRHCEERLRRSNPFFLYAVKWIASLRSQ
jgi:hypothetical protein